MRSRWWEGGRDGRREGGREGGWEVGVVCPADFEGAVGGGGEWAGCDLVADKEEEEEREGGTKHKIMLFFRRTKRHKA